MNWILHHPAWAAVIATWIFNNVLTVLISSLPAPTATSTAKYVYWFKVANTIIGNVARASSTALERSPNWQAAVDAHVTKMIADAQTINQANIAPSKGPTP